MPITLEPKTLEAFGIQSQVLAQKRRLLENHVARLLVFSFLTWGNLMQKRTFDNIAGRPLIDEIEGAIRSNNAYDATVGNLRIDRIRSLAQTLKTIPLLQNIFGANLIHQSYIEDTFHAIRLSEIVNKSPFETLLALCEFDHQIYQGQSVILNDENLHFMAAIPRRRNYSYAYNPSCRQFMVAEDRISPFLMGGGLGLADSWYGGRLHLEKSLIRIDDEAGEVQRDAHLIVKYLQAQYGRWGYQFAVKSENLLAEICGFSEYRMELARAVGCIPLKYDDQIVDVGPCNNIATSIVALLAGARITVVQPRIYGNVDQIEEHQSILVAAIQRFGDRFGIDNSLLNRITYKSELFEHSDLEENRYKAVLIPLVVDLANDRKAVYEKLIRVIADAGYIYIGSITEFSSGTICEEFEAYVKTKQGWSLEVLPQYQTQIKCFGRPAFKLYRLLKSDPLNQKSEMEGEGFEPSKA